MRWVRLLHEGSCETCGADTERFVRLMRNGYRATEVTFCPVCSPVVKGVVDIPVTDEEGGDTRRRDGHLHWALEAARHFRQS